MNQVDFHFFNFNNLIDVTMENYYFPRLKEQRNEIT